MEETRNDPEDGVHSHAPAAPAQEHQILHQQSQPVFKPKPSASPPPTLTTRISTRLRPLKPWRWELVASVFAIAGLFAIVGTILPHADQPLPQWPYAITVNGLLSIYSITIRGCLAFILASCIGQLQWAWFAASDRPLYDAVGYNDASRGPWGSFKWLCTVHKRKSPKTTGILTAVGAFLTLATLAIDPTVQQLIVPIPCTRPNAGVKATLPRSLLMSYFFHVPENLEVIDQELSTAIDQGITGSEEDVAVGCPSGNCTFPNLVGSLGVCSSCEDATANLLMSIQSCTTSGDCTNTSVPLMGENYVDYITELGIDNEFFEANPPSANLTLRSRELIMQMNETSQKATLESVFDIARSYGFTAYDSGLFKYWVLFGQTVYSNTGVDLATGFQIPGCNSSTIQSRRCRGYGAAHCTVRPCVRLYNSSVVNNRLTERLVETVDLPGPEKFQTAYIGVLDTDCVSPSDPIIASSNITIEPGAADQRWLPVRLDVDSAETLTGLVDVFSRQCLYLMDQKIVEILVRVSSWILQNGDASGADNLGVTLGDHLMVLPEFALNASAFLYALDVPRSSPKELKPVKGGRAIRQLYNWGNHSFERTDATMANITESITRWMRSARLGTDPVFVNYPANGTVLVNVTCISVRWGWIAYAASLTVLALSFFAVVVAVAAQNHTPVWKDSPLAWMFRGPLVEKGDEVENLDGESDEDDKTELERLEGVSERVCVRLLSGETTTDDEARTPRFIVQQVYPLTTEVKWYGRFKAWYSRMRQRRRGTSSAGGHGGSNVSLDAVDEMSSMALSTPHMVSSVHAAEEEGREGDESIEAPTSQHSSPSRHTVLRHATW
ncbi:hypothetical protein CKAH01_13549 [Colletotrichum kahawae]|uniref:Uncharacterized protein n=1 Tax=Colletotrichum kahawae TaxID=34407 RepID=A0AAD9YMZ0_COLKA|nr:hypothetical protein CKAH01_13549 [Colletotrichum kahawae]